MNTPQDPTDQQEFIAPDNGGWHYTIMRDWIAVCPNISPTAARVYWIVRSIMYEKGDRTRRLSLDELCWLLPGINGKTTSIDRVKDALRELEGIGLLSNPDGDVHRRWITDPTTGKQTRENYRRWQIHEYPPDTASYGGWKSAIAKLDAYPGPGWREAAKRTEGGKKPSQSRPAKARKKPGRTESGKNPSQSQADDQQRNTETPGHTERAFSHSEQGKKPGFDPVTRENPTPNEVLQGSKTNQPTPDRAEASSAEPVESSGVGWLGSSAEDKDETELDTAAGVAFLRSLVLPDGTKLTNEVVTGEAARTSVLLASGWSEKELAAELTDGTGIKVKSWVGLVRSKLRKQQPKQQQQAESAGSSWPEWCGECGQDDRRYMGEDGRLYRCPTCHRRSAQHQAPVKLVG